MPAEPLPISSPADDRWEAAKTGQVQLIASLLNGGAPIEEALQLPLQAAMAFVLYHGPHTGAAFLQAMVTCQIALAERHEGLPVAQESYRMAVGAWLREYQERAKLADTTTEGSA